MLVIVLTYFEATLVKAVVLLVWVYLELKTVLLRFFGCVVFGIKTRYCCKYDKSNKPISEMSWLLFCVKEMEAFRGTTELWDDFQFKRALTWLNLESTQVSQLERVLTLSWAESVDEYLEDDV